MREAPASVTVVIAARDAGDVIDDQLDALATQDCAPDLEVLVCDNGSRDGTRERALTHGEALPRLRVVDASAGVGAGHARNVGARHANGSYLLFCDADDVVGPDWVALMVAALEKDALVAGSLDATLLNPAWTVRARSVPQAAGLQASSFLPHASGQNLGVHRDAFWSVGGFDERQRHLEDTDLCWRLQLAGHRLGFEPRAVVHVRLRHTLLSLWRQGWWYGRAWAVLGRHYDLSDAGDARSLPVLGAGGRLLRSLSRSCRGRLGALAWQLGWHAGYRLWLRGAPAAPRRGRFRGPTAADGRALPEGRTSS